MAETGGQAQMCLQPSRIKVAAPPPTENIKVTTNSLPHSLLFIRISHSTTHLTGRLLSFLPFN